MQPSRIIILSLAIFITIPTTFAHINNAIINAQAGLTAALNTTFPAHRKIIRLEKREEGILQYKVTMRKLDGHTVKIRVIGYDGFDEVILTTHRLYINGRCEEINQSSNSSTIEPIIMIGTDRLQTKFAQHFPINK